MIVLSIPVICFMVFVHHVQGKHFALNEDDELFEKEIMTFSEEEGAKLRLKFQIRLNQLRCDYGSYNMGPHNKGHIVWGHRKWAILFMFAVKTN